MKRCVLAVCAVLAAGLAVPAADPPKPIDPAELDKRLYQVAFDTAAVGTKVYNGGDQAGCLKLYEGSLLALSAMLDHRPDLAKEVKARMREAEGQVAVSDRAFTLRKALDAIMDQTAAKAVTTKPLWDRLGGETGVTKVIDDFVAAAGADKEVDFFRGGKFPSDEKAVAKLKRGLVEMVSSVSGGPLKYSGRDMKTAHAGMKVTQKEFDKLAGHLKAALEKNKVGEAEVKEVMAAAAGTAKDIVEVK
jgi:hemoglobin